MVQHWLFARDRLLPLPTAGLKDFMEGEALHASCRTVKRFCFDVVRLRARVLTIHPFLWREHRLKKIILFPVASCC